MPGPRTTAALSGGTIVALTATIAGVLGAFGPWRMRDGPPTPATAADVSAAMQHDRFFSTYDHHTLAIFGTVDGAPNSDAAAPAHRLLLRAGAGRPDVSCRAFEGEPPPPGAAVWIEARDAARDGDAVVFAACRLAPNHR